MTAEDQLTHQIWMTGTAELDVTGQRAFQVFYPLFTVNDQRKVNIMASDLRYTKNQQVESLHARFVGTGHADLTKYEWLTHQHRDTYASIVGHPPLLNYLAVADGEASGRVKFELAEKMLQPVGLPPKREDDD